MEQSVKGKINGRDWRHSLMDLGLTAALTLVTFASNHIVPGLDLSPELQGVIASGLSLLAVMLRRAKSGPAADPRP